MELTFFFFLPFSGALLVLIAVLCPQIGSVGPPHATDSLVSASPPGQFPLLAPCRSFPMWRRDLLMLCLSRTCRNSFASFPMLCSSGNGSVSRWQGQLYCLVIWGRAAPLLLLWVLLWERAVLNLHPLLTCIWYISSSGHTAGHSGWVQDRQEQIQAGKGRSSKLTGTRSPVSMK